MKALPYYFAYQRTEKDGVVTITTLDLELDQSLMPADKDLIVYGDDITISGDLSIPGKNVTINARKINSDNGKIDTTGGKPVNDYTPGSRAKDGDPGKDPGSAGNPGDVGDKGSKGINAGNITVVAEQFVKSLGLVANGGIGGRGQDGGNGGLGKDGKPGADAKIQKSLQNDRIVAQPTAGGPGGNGGKGGDAGKSGDGGSGGVVLDSFITQKSDTTMSYEAGAEGATATPGQGGKFGKGGLGGRYAKCRNYPAAGDVITVCNLIDSRMPSGADGAHGKPGNSFPAVKGKSGSAGSVKIDYSDFISKYPSSFEQRTLTFHKMKLAYLAGLYPETKELLAWLRNVTPQQKNPADGWGQLHKRVTSLLVQLNQGLDYYGYSWIHVPLVSLGYYQKQLSSLLILGGQVEQVYRQYLDNEKDQQKQQAAFQSALDNAKASLKRLADDKDNIITEKTKTQESIAHISDEQAEQERILFLSEEKFQDALTQYFELKMFSEFFSMMVSLVTIGADVYSAGKAIFNICGELSKEAIDFKNMIKQVKEVAGKVTDITKQWNTIKNLNTPDNPDTSKLIMKREEFDEVMKQFVDKFPEAQEYENQVHTYLDIIQNRNQKVVEYNAFALQEIMLDAKIEQKKAELAGINDHWAKEKDPTAPLMRMYMLNLYEDLKENVLDYLYQENQAFRYWSLTWNDFSVGDNTIAELSTYHTDLEGKIFDLLNARGKPVQPFKNVKIVLKLSELPEEFASFEKRSKLTFSLPVTCAQFEGLAQVIATDFTIEIKNASTDDDKLYVLLTSNGRAPFLDINGKEFIFSHSAVTALYKYRISSGDYIAGGKLGGDNNEYIGLSPFTTWTIELPSKYNHGLKLDAVDEIVLIFSGRGLPMNLGAKENVKTLTQKRSFHR
jgi:hypothetical protein